VKSRVRPAAAAAAPTGSPLNPQGGVPGEERMAVYAEGYQVRIREALAERFEAVRFVLGEETFRRLSAGYAAAHPSRDYNLSLAGRHLPNFLRSDPLGRELPFLPDLADLEWEVAEVFHAEWLPPLPPERFAGIPPERLEQVRLSFQPGLRTVRSDWPVLEIWKSRKQERSTVKLQVAGRPQSVLIRREEMKVRCELLAPAALRLLEALRSGRTVGEGLERLEAAGESDPPVGDWFSAWMGAGLIVSFET